MNHPLDRVDGLYPSGEGLSWAITENHTIGVMHFHMRSATADSRHNIAWEQEENHDERTELHYKIEGVTPVDHDPNGRVTQMFEATIKTPEGKVLYREDCDINTTRSHETTKIQAICTANISLPNRFPASIVEQMPGRTLREVIGGDHPLINAIGGLTIRNVIQLESATINTILELFCTEWQSKIVEIHQAYEASRPKEELADA